MKSHHTASPDQRKGLLAALAVVLFWSGFNIVSRLGATAAFTPFDIAAIRFGVSGVIGLPLFLLCVPRKDWSRHAVLGALPPGALARFRFSS